MKRSHLFTGMTGFGLLAAALWVGTEPGNPPSPAVDSPNAEGGGRGLSSGPGADRAEAEAGEWTPERSAALAAHRAQVAESYRRDQLVVAPRAGESLAGIAERHGLEVLTPVGASGHGALSLPPGLSIEEIAGQLRDDDRVAAVMPNAITRGSGSSAADLQRTADELAVQADEADAALRAAEAEVARLTALGILGGTMEDALAALEYAQGDAIEAHAKAFEAQVRADDAAVFEYRAKVRSVQWSLKGLNHPKWTRKSSEWVKVPDPDFSALKVAILDTGVAYEDYQDGNQRYVAAPSLARSTILAPLDVVNGDNHANDDHQHGTHIATLIAGEGDLAGLAPGVTLVPIKVLNAQNTGTELALVEGIHHAVDVGVDVINLSLSFGEGYVPSPMLAEAIERAHDAGIVMVAASGNRASREVTWPAASRRVIAVGSVGEDSDFKNLRLAPYGNLGGLVDLVAPGGITGEDRDGDGFDDGILAETIAPGDPTQLGYWFYAGTSQAAALVTGSVLRLLAQGVPAADCVRLLQYTANDDLEGHPFEDGWGAGYVDLVAADEVNSQASGRARVASRGDAHISVMPWVEWRDSGKKKRAQARFTLVDDAGMPLSDMTVMGRVTGSQTLNFDCKTDNDGQCEVRLSEVETRTASGQATDPGLAWAFTVEAIVRDGMSAHPGGLLMATPGLDALVAALDADPDTAQASLAIRWERRKDDEMGELAESYTVLSGGTGISTSPMGVVFTPGVLSGLAQTQDLNVSFGGSGISTSPMGIVPGQLIRFVDGSGISTSPMGFQLPPLIALSGTGISTSPMGFHPLALTQRLEGTGISTSPMGLLGEPILMSKALITGTSANLDALQARLDQGGWLSQDGYPATGLLAASGLLFHDATGLGSAPTSSPYTSASHGGPGECLSTEEIDAIQVEAVFDLESPL